MSRRRGSGTIYKQAGCSTWTIQYYKNGKRIREATGETDYAAARQQLNKQLGAIAKGEYLERDRKPVSIAELYEALERHYRVNGRKSIDALARRWNKHLKGFFGAVAAQSVTSELIDAYVDTRLRENAANATINRELAVVKTMFRLGYGKRRLMRLPLFPHLEENNVRTGFIDDRDYRGLTKHASELWLRLFLELSYTYGWRKQELLGLRVRQIDLDWKTIRLNVGSTKNKDGREVTMTSTVLELMHQAVEGKGPDDFVLTRHDRKPVKDFRKSWQNLCVQAGLGVFVCRVCRETLSEAGCECGSRKRKYKGLIVHDFRRSAARALRRAGVPESVVMSIGGWKTAAMFRRYAIVSHADQKAAVERLEQARSENGHDFSHDSTLKARAGMKAADTSVN
jgi:integrase